MQAYDYFSQCIYNIDAKQIQISNSMFIQYKQIFQSEIIYVFNNPISVFRKIVFYIYFYMWQQNNQKVFMNIYYVSMS